jgi:hypothetical protein
MVVSTCGSSGDEISLLLPGCQSWAPWIITRGPANDRRTNSRRRRATLAEGADRPAILQCRVVSRTNSIFSPHNRTTARVGVVKHLSLGYALGAVDAPVSRGRECVDDTPWLGGRGISSRVEGGRYEHARRGAGISIPASRRGARSIAIFRHCEAVSSWVLVIASRHRTAEIGSRTGLGSKATHK